MEVYNHSTKKKAVVTGKIYTRQHEDNTGQETKWLQDILEQ